MWRSAVIFLCLLSLHLGFSQEDGAQLTEERAQAEITRFYSLLDVVDEATIGDIDNVIRGEDDVRDDDDSDDFGIGDVINPDAVVVDPPEAREVELPTVQLNEEFDSNDDDDDDSFATKRPGKRGGRWKKKMQKRKEWKKRKQARKMRLVDGNEQDRTATERGTDSPTRNGSQWRRKHPRGRGQRQEVGNAGGKRWMHKMERKVTKKMNHPVPSKIYNHHRNASSGERDGNEDDEEMRPIHKHGAPHKDKHGRWGHHKGRGNHQNHHGPNHRRGAHRRPNFRRAPLEKRVAMVCAKLTKPKNQHFLQVVNEKYAQGIGDVDRKAYRLQYVERMLQCCQNNVTRQACFVSLTHERIDNFCNNQLPLKPWMRRGRRPQFKQQCCQQTGELRYGCFQTAFVTDPETTETSTEAAMASTSSTEIRDLLEENDEEEDHDDDEETAPKDNRKQGRNHRGQKGKRPARAIKRQCCHAGKAAGSTVQTDDARTRCIAEGRRFAENRPTFRAMCGAFFGRCCIHVARRGESEHGTLDDDDETDSLGTDGTPPSPALIRPTAEDDGEVSNPRREQGHVKNDHHSKHTRGNHHGRKGAKTY